MKIHPYDEITVKQITLEAKLSRKTFYRNFESKDDILHSLIKNSLHGYYALINNATGDILTTLFSFAEKNKEFLLLLDRNNMLHVVLQCMNDYDPLIRREIVSDDNPFNKLFEGLDPSYLMAMLIGAFWNVIAKWVHQGMDANQEDVIKTVREYVQRIIDLRIK